MNKRQKLSSGEIIGRPKEEISHIDDLPVEMLQEVFSYLNRAELCRIGRVSKKWHTITRSPVFWMQVDVDFLPEYKSMSEATMKFVEILPSCITHLRLNYEDLVYCGEFPSSALNLSDLSSLLQKRCPNLEVLILHRARFNRSRATLSFCEQLKCNIRVLALHYVVCDGVTVLDIPDTVLSKIEVVDISRSSPMILSDSFYSRVPHLKKLRIAGSGMGDYCFESHPSIVSGLQVLDMESTSAGHYAFKAVLNYGLHLVELYMCFTALQDKDLIFDNSTDVLPCLEKVCLRGSNVTYEGVNLLLKSCKSLQYVGVDDEFELPDDDDDNFYDSDTSEDDEPRKYNSVFDNSEKVHIIESCEPYCDHYKKINYMSE